MKHFKTHFETPMIVTFLSEYYGVAGGGANSRLKTKKISFSILKAPRALNQKKLNSEQLINLLVGRLLTDHLIDEVC